MSKKMRILRGERDIFKFLNLLLLVLDNNIL